MQMHLAAINSFFFCDLRNYFQLSVVPTVKFSNSAEKLALEHAQICRAKRHASELMAFLVT